MRAKLISIFCAAVVICSCSAGPVTAPGFYAGDSPIYPDYRDVVVPRSIAPLDFTYLRGADKNTVTTFSCGEKSVEFKGVDVKWPERKWESLLAEAVGKVITVHSTADIGDWTIAVSADDIDYGVAYRLIPPGYELYGSMGIYERELSSFRQTVIADNRDFKSACVNCHAFRGCSADSMSLHFRGECGGTLLKYGDNTAVFNTKTPETGGNCVYPYWHREGRYIAYSVNMTKQSFYAHPSSILEVFDRWSDLVVYDTRENKIIDNPSVRDTGYLETFPAFSADGRSIYFCRAAAADSTATNARSLNYNLCRVAFDPMTGKTGDDIEVVYDAASEGHSVAFPRPSFDGRYLMFTLSDSGTFPIWHKEADLWMIDLSSGEMYALDGANSPDTESFHSWSSNSKWVVFSSRRDDGRYTRLYISHINDSGRADKAFMLPQRNPAKYYDELMFSYNVPCFVDGPVKMNKAIVSGKVKSKNRIQFGFGN